MRRYRLSSHAKYDLKVHLVWCPKYRKLVLTGQVATRVREAALGQAPVGEGIFRRDIRHHH